MTPLAGKWTPLDLEAFVRQRAPQVDREVLNFVRSQVFTPRDYVMDAKGVGRLHSELARRLVRLNACSVELESSLTNALSVATRQE